MVDLRLGSALTWRAVLAALALLAAFVLSSCSATQDDPSHGMDHGDSSDASGEANRADVMFATMMIPHHEQAIEMSDVILAKDGIDPRVLALAERIKQAQGPEIEQMEQWLDEWDAGMGQDMGDGGHGSGMMSHDDMEALEDAEGETAARVFLEQMIEHHEGAIEMARDEVEDGRDPDAVGLAGSIVASQTLEIEEMEDLLAGL